MNEVFGGAIPRNVIPASEKGIIEAAEKGKIELSNPTETAISLPFITFDPETRTPMHLEPTLTRAQFEELTADLLRRVRKPDGRDLTAPQSDATTTH